VVTPTPPPSGPTAQWVACDDTVDGGPCINLNNRPLLSLLLAKLASSTSPQKPPATYTWVTDFGPHTDSIFRGATYTWEWLIREYIRYYILITRRWEHLLYVVCVTGWQRWQCWVVRTLNSWYSTTTAPVFTVRSTAVGQNSTTWGNWRSSSFRLFFHHGHCDVGQFYTFLPARRYASAGNSDRNVSVCLSRASIVSKRRKLVAWFLHHLVAPWL